jgi:carboxypeptidase C (cathepsin A)
LNGGPGASSVLFGLLFENGPLKINDNLTTRINPYSWNRNTTMSKLIFVCCFKKEDGGWEKDGRRGESAEDDFFFFFLKNNNHRSKHT